MESGDKFKENAEQWRGMDNFINAEHSESLSGLRRMKMAFTVLLNWPKITATNCIHTKPDKLKLQITLTCPVLDLVKISGTYFQYECNLLKSFHLIDKI